MSRNILAPPLVYMSNNRRYRVNLVHEDFSDQRQAAQAAMKGNLDKAKQAYNERDLYGEEHNDEIDDDLSDIECHNSAFRLKMHVASAFYGGLVGFKGATKRRLELETSTEITIPPRVADNGNRSRESNVIIKGKTRNAVATAKRKIDVLVASLRARMTATHFYGVALNRDDILENFQELVLSAELPSIDESLFQLDSSLHATFGACVLMDDVERNKAATILQSCREFLADVKTPFKVNVRGLEIMNDDPSAVRVLYAIIDSPDLQSFSDRCLQRFIESGFVRDAQREHVKLHMTLMNNRYKEAYSPDTSTKEITKTFDAREILKRWGNFDFGSVQCKEILLCVIGSSRETKGSFYKISSTLKCE
uniref:K Homology domain-containing protein n=1 Tax=Glossina pallidipes TaxID=7398 RepID=A0A1A9ZE03_GLOPL